MNTIAEDAVVVIHADVSNVRAGVDGETTPRLVLATPDGLIGSQGSIRDRDIAKNILSQVFQDLNVDPEGHAVLLVTVAMASEANIASLGACLFEDFNAPALSFVSDSAVTIVAKGDDTNGMAVHVTGTDARTTCVLKNRSALHTVTIATDISSGVYSSMRKTDPTEWKQLCANINLTGDASPESAKILKQELTKLIPVDFTINVIVTDEPQSAVWRAASAWSTLSTFQKSLATRSEYDENGPGIAHQKFMQ